jgi:hypothetical protein
MAIVAAEWRLSLVLMSFYLNILHYSLLISVAAGFRKGNIFLWGGMNGMMFRKL